MKRTEKYDVPATMRERTAEFRCDLCGADSPDPHGETWQSEPFEVNEVTVEHIVGSSYPDGGNRRGTVVDICPKCFATKLLPWLAEQGAKPRTETSDW